MRATTFELVGILLRRGQGAGCFPWAEFRHKVGLHNGCSTLQLREAKVSDQRAYFQKPMDLLSKVKGC